MEAIKAKKRKSKEKKSAHKSLAAGWSSFVTEDNPSTAKSKREVAAEINSMEAIKANKRKSKESKSAQKSLAAGPTSSVTEDSPSTKKSEVRKASKRKKDLVVSGNKKNFRKNKIEVGVDEVDQGTSPVDKDKKTLKRKKNELIVRDKKKKSNESKIEASVAEVAQISSVDEDCSKGMKKWLNDYWKSRPGLRILQQNIDEFIIDHEAREEKARKEREAQAAEGGWTVVVHHKGRKKTTDSESGIAVGSVAQAAVIDNMAKKKNKEIPLDFYRFQKREARRSEVMMLQSKFEQDKLRIQQLRAARKFRPY